MDRSPAPAELPTSNAPGPTETIAGTYEVLGPLLRNVAIRKFRIPHDDAYVLVQDIFVGYLTRPDTIRDPRAYLIGAICNASRNYWRSRQRELATEENQRLEETPCQPEWERAEIRSALRATLARLGKRCRETLRRYYLAGESTADIAAAYDTTTDYILHVLHRCRLQAREIYRTLTEVSL
jgi:RNA polymerase sigma factor (sigma-70 family)